MIGGVRLLDAGFGCPHRLIRKSLQPQNPRKVDVRHHAMVDRKVNERRLLIGSELVGQRSLEVTPRARLVAQMVLCNADHPLTHRAIVRVAGTLTRRSGTFPPEQARPGADPYDVEQPEAPYGAQPVFGSSKALGKFESPRAGSGDFRHVTIGGYKACAQRCMELHRAARVPVSSGRDSSEGLAHAAKALLDQRQLNPKRHSGDSQRHADRSITSGEKAQSSAARRLPIFGWYSDSHSAVGRTSHSVSARSKSLR